VFTLRGHTIACSHHVFTTSHVNITRPQHSMFTSRVHNIACSHHAPTTSHVHVTCSQHSMFTCSHHHMFTSRVHNIACSCHVFTTSHIHIRCPQHPMFTSHVHTIACSYGVFTCVACPYWDVSSRLPWNLLLLKSGLELWSAPRTFKFNISFMFSNKNFVFILLVFQSFQPPYPMIPLMITDLSIHS
jgi:hypothetical protein